jgi:archaellum biogenesis ATPase FlaH
MKLLISKDHMDTLFAPSVAESKSSMASSYAGKAIRIDVPSRPKNDDGQELEQFECPYCLLTKNVSNDRRWKKHVLEDLQPYVCTYGDCELYDHFFESRDAWFKHEAQQHRTKWSCNVDGHMEYDSEGHFLLHMRADHDQNFDEVQFSLVKSMFRRPTNSLEGTCNLCDRPSKNLRSHLSRHLQQIAICALPRVNETAGSGQAERDSRSSRYKKDNLDDGESSGSSSSSTDVLQDDQTVPNDSTSDTFDVEDDYNEGENIPDAITDQGWDDITDKFTKARERTFRLLRILLLEMNDESRNKMVALIKRLKVEPIVIMSDQTSTADALQNHAESDAIIIGDAFGSSALNATIRQIRDVTYAPIVVIHESASTLGPIPNISDWTELYEPSQGDIEEALGSFCQWAPAPPHWRPATSNHMDSISGAEIFTTGIMRLLRYEEDGRLTIASFDDAIPPYAILSHTWGPDAEEVTFADLAQSSRKDKPGYTKIRFCGEQAQRDGLQYFWVDTCCIDKSNKAELSLAIQSMFRWYQNATRCYVYLSDVSTTKRKLDNMLTQFTWESAFRSSRWFTRGWTLQELLAPRIVEFFSEEWDKLGDKMLLKSLIHKITSISCKALDGAPLSQFSVNERLRWIEHRHTTRPEDKAYSLSGVVNVELAPCYGEGEDVAFKRLYDEIDKTKRCIQDLCGTDPRNDKKRIEDTKGGLLKDSYCWVLHNDSFRQWHEDPQSRLLWIKGDPGKGKTMLLCGIIDELQASSTIAKKNTVSYFFCQATDARINSATAVLRGLLYMLVKQQLSLASHVRKKYDMAGKNMFEDANAWVALVDIFTDVLRDLNLTTTYLVVDALDGCVTDLPKLLDFVVKQSSASSRVKWIVSSRNWPEIETRLEQAGHKVRLSLELNAASVSTAVQAYIKQKVSELAQQNKYDELTQRAVLERLTSNANDTFLWVALVCQHLQTTAKRNVLRKLELFPPGLDALYERMMQQISKTDDAELCKQVLAAVALVYRPITLKELVTLVEPLEGMADDSELQEIISLCGSFLTLREQTVYFVHQSAKDFLLAKAAQDVFPAGREAVHQAIFARSLQIMSTTLRRDMHGLKALGTPIDDVEMPTPDPLAALRYPCVYWIDHLHDSKPESWANSVADLQMRAVYNFLREKYLYWLEALSLCHSVGKGVVSMEKLWSLVQVCPTRFARL